MRTFTHPSVTTHLHSLETLETANHNLRKAQDLILSQQTSLGAWWYTLEANESIAAGYIQLMHFIGDVNLQTQAGLVQRMLSEQSSQGPSAGSWSLFFGGAGDLSITVECYFALRLAGMDPNDPPLQKAREFILSQGGLEKVRIFTRIHLALFGLVPWSACPSMPVWLMLLPVKSGFSIYEFSSWARACIVPLLLIDSVKPIHKLGFNLSELIKDPSNLNWEFPKNIFSTIDRVLKKLEKLPYHPGKKKALKLAEEWTREHIERTEDIYPAMAYAVLALKSLGYPNSDPTIQKALNGLKRFQQSYHTTSLPTLPTSGAASSAPTAPALVHQQCCISPIWDTPWAGLALLESGLDPKDPALLKAARFLISKEIKDFRGDWKYKNPNGPAGGWSFEFQNDYFPDLDDTLVILNFLKSVSLPPEEVTPTITRSIQWILSMQSDNGGWAAFDKNNTANWVNKIPFADHGACQDPPTPDITGRMIECLTQFGYTPEHPAIQKALKFLKNTQESNGAWKGRWGVNFIHGTWAVFQGLKSVGENFSSPYLQKAVVWLKSIQNPDGGWGESCLSDEKNEYVPLGESIASQTAWALMALITAGEKNSESAYKGAQWLITHQNEAGGWDEKYFSGTGFPGHFYIRYHGYRHYFPLMALARYVK